ncbi:MULTISPECIES: hypothetical protein [Mesobacillus]|uniref:hypothetical protein n=1 Tax=Mesobacillus TaxID=2675231 RepID=UPI00178180B1|nr:MULTISPECIES: hypothetical protein [Mesobacillus]MCM3572308.1 hypothetical protein [Mesobacillus subterraneus]UYZ24002.1 hypothetical protein FOF60_10900 [Mesobacillus jeotgali]
MAKTVLSNKGSKNPRTFFEESSFFRMLRFAFLLFLSFLLVYTYYLHLTGNLQKTILTIWSNYKQVIIASSILVTYTGIVFQLGVWRGRRS